MFAMPGVVAQSDLVMAVGRGLVMGIAVRGLTVACNNVFSTCRN